MVLAGGRSARMGRDKSRLVLDGRSLLARAVSGCAGRELVVVVAASMADDVRDDRVLRVLEDPPFGGPVAGLVAGLATLPAGEPSDEVLVLACDLPQAAGVVRRLDAAPLGPDGTCLVDDEGFAQYLAARYRRTALATALPPPEASRNRSVHRTLRGLDLLHVPAGEVVHDVDTPDEARAAGLDAES